MTRSCFDAAAGARIEELLHDPRVVAVGECGLDFYRMRSPVEDQVRALKAHIALSNESGKPMVVHVRDAWPDVLRVLDEGSAERVVIHCFSGDATIARECAERGYWISFAGNVTYPEERTSAPSGTRAWISTASSSRPTHRSSLRRRFEGHDNEPANVVFAIAEVARVRDEDRADRCRGHLAQRDDGVPRPFLDSNARSVLKVAVRVEGC